VLVVEDSPSDSFLIRNQLARATPGFNCEFATTLTEALALATRSPPDVVLLDLSLPDSHGIQTLRRFREGCPAPAVMVLTGHSELRLAIQALRAGARDYLPKSELADLEPTLRRVLSEAISDRHDQESGERRLTRLKQESVGRLAAGVAHEINTPLQFVSDNLVFLRRSVQLLSPVLEQLGRCPAPGAPPARGVPTISAKLQHVIEQMQPAIEQALDGVNHIGQLIAALKPRQGAGEERTLVELRHVLEPSLAMWQEMGLSAAGITTHYAEDLPLIAAFVQDLTTAFSNIIINAGEAVAKRDRPVGGSLHVSVTRRGERVEARFTDNGVGIMRQHLGQIFEPFFTTKSTGYGAGQGLAVAYHIIVQEHGGELTVDSTPAVGSTFIVSLPISTGSP
jgi:two-component system NtrC family sensor kinase